MGIKYFVKKFILNIVFSPFLGTCITKFKSNVNVQNIEYSKDIVKGVQENFMS